MPRHVNPQQLSTRLRARLSRFKQELTQIEIALAGSVTERWMPCGKKNCRCQADPPQLHGPYYQWTAKIDGKTKTLRLRAEEVEDFRHWIAQGQHLDECVREWKRLSLEAVEQSRAKSRG